MTDSTGLRRRYRLEIAVPDVYGRLTALETLLRDMQTIVERRDTRPTVIEWHSDHGRIRDGGTPIRAQRQRILRDK